ncbi:hypothetical protein [Microtetraspora malaysiensis]|uniref:Pyrroline-5-carboxylate reductase catalytic N-terminal domain-containing protein n=1 Tax=Microtetraspora malaysiensis TaxID=161358 RepID=A0ABW6SP95_9ACTN
MRNSTTPLRLGILGAGPIGRAIGRFWIDAGGVLFPHMFTPADLTAQISASLAPAPVAVPS